MEEMYQFLLDLGVEPKKAKQALKIFEEVAMKTTFERASKCGSI